MESAGSVVGVVDGIAPNIAGVHGARDVEMYRVPEKIRKIIKISEKFVKCLPPYPEGLAYTGKLRIAYPRLN